MEAAHAVAAIEFGLNLRYVTIIPDVKENSLGHIVRKPKKNAFATIEFTYTFTPKAEQYVKHNMICSFAGQAAEANYLRIPFNVANAYTKKIKGGDSDLKNFVEIAEKLHPDKKLLQAYYNYIIEEARVFVSTDINSLRIKAIAKELMKKKKLSKKECLDICTEEVRKKLKIKI